MNTSRLPLPGSKLLWGVLALSSWVVSVQAQQISGYSYPPPPGYNQQSQYQAPRYPAQAPAYPQQGYPQQSYPQQGYAQPGYQSEYVSPMQFLPTFGRKFGDMFRRMFYGDAPPSGYQTPQGYPQQGRSLDSAPPSYQSHYGQPPTGYSQQPGYRQSPSYQQPRYQQPQQQVPVPQYQVPPPAQRQAPPPNSRMGTSEQAPRMSVKPKTTPQSAPPKKYTPPTITRNNTSTTEELPPSNPSKKETASAAETEYYPLPGAQPKKEQAKTSSSKSKTDTAGNSGAFLKGKKASKEGRVISPYPPYQELDVTGLSSGSLALDPTTQKVFEVP